MPEKVTAQEIQFLQIQGFFKPFGQPRAAVFYATLSEDQKKVVDALVEKRILEVSTNEVKPWGWVADSSGWSYCHSCPSKSQSRLMMTIHARNSKHMTTYIPKPTTQYREIRTP